MIADLIAIIAPVFLCAALGYIWGKAKRPYDTEFVTTLATSIGTPCLVFSTLTSLQVTVTAFAEIAYAAIAAVIAFAVVGGACLRLARLPNHSYLPSLMFPNAGNMGLPLSLFAFGEPGLALGISYFTITSVSQFTIGASIAAGSASIGKLLRTPMIYSVIFGLIVMIGEIQVPRWIANTVELVGGVTIPLMLLTLGVSLAKLRVGGLGRASALAMLRLCMGFGVGLGLAYLFGLEGMARGVFILQCSMPVAVFNYLFAQRYKRAPEEVAGMVLISTTVSFATLPFLLIMIL
jgi:predicted permease